MFALRYGEKNRRTVGSCFILGLQAFELKTDKSTFLQFWIIENVLQNYVKKSTKNVTNGWDF